MASNLDNNKMYVFFFNSNYFLFILFMSLYKTHPPDLSLSPLLSLQLGAAWQHA